VAALAPARACLAPGVGTRSLHSCPPMDHIEPLGLLLTILTAWVKRATTRTNSDRRLYMCPPGRREQGSRGRAQRYEVIMVTYADVIAKLLADTGIEYIFGMPGSRASVELIEAARKQGIHYVLSNNESAAAVMAATYGVLQRRPGVCSVGVGPGATNVVNGVAHALLERAPLLLFTDRYPDDLYRHLPRQRVDQEQLFRPITKSTFPRARCNAPCTSPWKAGLALCISTSPMMSCNMKPPGSQSRSQPNAGMGRSVPTILPSRAWPLPSVVRHVPLSLRALA